MELLKKRGISEAEVDSAARHPPPRCHMETRRALRQRITAWIEGVQRDWAMLWILGPAGVGKSAVAQTTAEYCQGAGRLGAAFFFSRENERDDHLRVIPTLAHRLAVQDPEYRKLVTRILGEDSTILEHNLRSQFQRLIVEPFAQLDSQGSRYRLIILDGLDECKEEDAQCEFVKLINEYTRQNRKSPLLWMICSRPEAHLKRLLPRIDLTTCQLEELSIDDIEAKEDVYRILRDGFRDICNRWPGFCDVEDDGTWPSETQLRQIAAVASGLFIFAATILKFVDDKHYRNPQSQLEICLESITSSAAQGSVNPLDALDHLYRRILSAIHPSTFPITTRILSLLILYPPGFRTQRFVVQNVVNFLCLKLNTLYSAVERLHSVLYIPPLEKTGDQVIRLYHASFSDFLRDPNRSGQFALMEGPARRDLAVCTIKWYNYLMQSFCNSEGTVHLMD